MADWNVIIRTFGERDYFLSEALYSLAMQGADSIKVIVAYHLPKGGSLNETKKLVERFRSYFEIEEVELIRGETTRSELMNLALEKVSSGVVSFLDDDDVYYPNFFADIVKPLLDSEVTFAFGDYCNSYFRKSENGVFVERKELIKQGDFNKLKLLLDNYLPIHTFAFKRELLADLRFDPKLEMMEDWDLLARLCISPAFVARYVPFAVAEYRRDLESKNTGFTLEREGEWSKTRKMIRERIFAQASLNISGKDLGIFSSYFDQIFAEANNFEREKRSIGFRVLKKIRGLSGSRRRST